MWSIITAVIGVLGTWVVVTRGEGKDFEWRAQPYWFLGLAGLFPAWLIAFLALLQPATQGSAEVPLPPRALLSSGAALCGVIFADYLLRRLQNSGRRLRPVTCWIIGWMALLPAWCIALVNF